MNDVINTKILATVEIFLVSIPESVSLLLFGAGLIVLAVVIRSILARRASEQEKSEKF